MKRFYHSLRNRKNKRKIKDLLKEYGEGLTDDQAKDVIEHEG